MSPGTRLAPDYSSCPTVSTEMTSDEDVFTLRISHSRPSGHPKPVLP